MSGLILSNNARYLWAAEAVYGQDAVDIILKNGARDIIYQQTTGITITPEGEAVHVARERGSGSVSRHGFIKNRAAIAGEIPLQGFISTTDQVPHADAILQAMGLKVDLTTASKSTYSPETAETGSVTIYKFERLAESSKWRLTVVTGVRLTGSLTVAMNAEPIISIEGGGTYTTMGEAKNFFATDGSIALQKDGTTPVVARTTGDEIIADQDPMMCVGMSVTVGSTARTVSAIELSLNSTVTALGAVTGAASTVRHVHTRGNQGSRIGGSFTLADYGDAEIDGFINDYEAANEMSASVVF